MKRSYLSDNDCILRVCSDMSRRTKILPGKNIHEESERVKPLNRNAKTRGPIP